MGETGIGTTSAVGVFPSGVSPYGCLDMAGNVWEWTQSQYKAYPYDPTDGRENLEAGEEALRGLRGGSFDYAQYFVRCAGRFRHYPNLRDYFIGFRVVVSPISPTSAL